MKQRQLRKRTGKKCFDYLFFLSLIFSSFFSPSPCQYFDLIHLCIHIVHVKLVPSNESLRKRDLWNVLFSFFLSKFEHTRGRFGVNTVSLAYAFWKKAVCLGTVFRAVKRSKGVFVCEESLLRARYDAVETSSRHLVAVIATNVSEKKFL